MLIFFKPQRINQDTQKLKNKVCLPASIKRILNEKPKKTSKD